MKCPFGSKSIVFSTCLIVCLLGAKITSTFPLTSQYLGSQTRGNEHLLLFKLPETISSQVLEQHQQQQRFTPIIQQRQSQSVISVQQQPQAQQPQQLHLQQHPSQPETVEEQSISLTIPLSTIQAVNHQHTQPGLIAINPIQDQQQQQQQQQQIAQQIHLIRQHQLLNQAKQAGLEPSTLIEYLASSLELTNQGPEPSDISTTSAASRQPQLLLARQHRSLAPTPDQQFRELLFPTQPLVALPPQPQPPPPQALAPEPLLQTLANPFLSASPIPPPPPPPAPVPQPSHLTVVAPEPQPALWRDTPHPPGPLIVPSPPALILANQTLPSSNSSDLSGLLHKLTNSSPDLLLRLRSLLRRAAQQQQLQQQQVALAPGPLQPALAALPPPAPLVPLAFPPPPPQPELITLLNHTLDSHNLTQQSHWANQHPLLAAALANNQHSFQGLADNLSHPVLGDNHMMQSFLSNQNLSSHEEIKIPLVVIAMPRILSLKRNQLASNWPRGLNGSHSSGEPQGLPSISSALVQRLIRQHLPSLAGQNASNLTQDTHNLAPNNTHNIIQFVQQQPTATNYSQTPLIFLTSRANEQQHQQQQAIPTSPTTSMPQHTMAPYAQQFVTPQINSVPLVRQYLPQQTETSLSPIYKLIQASNQTNLDHQRRPLIEFVTRPQHLNATQPEFIGIRQHQQQQQHNYHHHNQQQHQIGDDQLQYQVISNPNEPRGGQQQQYLTQSSFETQHQQQQPQQDELSDPRDKQQHVVYLAPYSSQSQSHLPRLIPARAQFNNNESPLVGNQEPRSPVAKSSFEESISKLRPLFQASKRSSSGHHQLGAHQRHHLMSPSQMLNLLSRANERRAPQHGARYVQQQEPIEQQNNEDELDQQAQASSSIGTSVAAKKAPKMVLMIV